MYLPPISSSYYKHIHLDTSSLFDLLQNDILAYERKGNLILIGDCNARIGNLNDEIDDNFNKYSNDLRNEDYIVDGTVQTKKNIL